MGWTPEDQAFFVGLNLGPTLAAKGFGDIKIMIMDDQRILLPKWAKTVNRKYFYLNFFLKQFTFWLKVLSHPEAKKYVAGIAVHWYGDLLTSPSVLSGLHDLFPDHFILATEACEGTDGW